MNNKNSFLSLEEQYQKQQGSELPNLTPPHSYRKIKKNDPNLIDEGFLICEVKKLNDDEFKVTKTNSRLELLSVSEISKITGSFAEIAISTTGYWFSSNHVVAATGYAELLIENEDYGVYKLEIQIQKWR